MSLPPGWIQTTLGHALTWSSGGTPRSTEQRFYGGGIPWVVIGDLTDALVIETASTITEAGLRESAAKWVRPGSVLVAMYGSIGKLGLAAFPLATNQAIAFADPKPIEPKYLFWYLMSRRRDLQRAGKGGTQQNISQAVLKQFPFILAPLVEQRRIVSAIEEHLSRLDAAVAGLKRVRAMIPPFRAALLSMACDGKLALKLGLNFSPDIRPLGDLLEGIQAGKSFKCDERPPLHTETGVVKVSAVTWGKFDELESKTVRDARRIESRFMIRRGDLLFSRANTLELVGACVIVRSDPHNLMLSDKILRLVPKDRVSARWVLLCLRSPEGRRSIESLATGNQQSMRNIGQQRIRQIPIPIFPAHVTEALTTEVERQLSLADAVAANVETALLRAGAFRQSILNRAFEGKLVAQDPNDEPASALLERIRETKARLPKQSKKSRIPA